MSSPWQRQADLYGRGAMSKPEPNVLSPGKICSSPFLSQRIKPTAALERGHPQVPLSPVAPPVSSPSQTTNCLRLARTSRSHTFRHCCQHSRRCLEASLVRSETVEKKVLAQPEHAESGERCGASSRVVTGAAFTPPWPHGSSMDGTATLWSTASTVPQVWLMTNSTTEEPGRGVDPQIWYVLVGNLRSVRPGGTRGVRLRSTTQPHSG